jgi:CO/xanthine dehydrogenase FAD-binding subunit
MRSNVPMYELRTPKSLTEALGLLSEWRPFAGGTDLMVLFEAGKLQHRRFVNIWPIPELRGIHVTPDSITLGALTTYTEIREQAILNREFPLLAEAAKNTGGVATQNRGTIGGNIVNASPAADSPPALLVYDAELELISARGSRRLAYRDFHTGYKQMRMEPDELLASITLRRDTAGWRQTYRKVGTRMAQAISKVCFAAVQDRATGETRIAFASVAPVPLRCVRTEQAIAAGADPLAAVAAEMSPIDDIRSVAAYRRRVAQNLLRDFLAGR